MRFISTLQRMEMNRLLFGKHVIEVLPDFRAIIAVSFCIFCICIEKGSIDMLISMLIEHLPCWDQLRLFVCETWAGASDRSILESCKTIRHEILIFLTLVDHRGKDLVDGLLEIISRDITLQQLDAPIYNRPCLSQLSSGRCHRGEILEKT